jgi:hypothetical protein
MRNVLDTERPAASPIRARAAVLAARHRTSQPAPTPVRRWRAFALLAVAYFITIVEPIRCLGLVGSTRMSDSE